MFTRRRFLAVAVVIAGVALAARAVGGQEPEQANPKLKTVTLAIRGMT